MLSELRIENFAIIDQLEIFFQPGLIVFTGETGAGKSIIIDAVQLLLGGRADSTMIRSGAERALIEATFEIPEDADFPIQGILLREDLLDDKDTLYIGREVRSEGRSTARLNGRVVNLGLLKEIGELLVDLHGQSEHLSLLRVKEHLALLDRYADNQTPKQNYSKDFHALSSVKNELKRLRQSDSEAARRLDILDYQINEISSAKLEYDEEDLLITERNRLANAENLASAAQQALVKLEDGTPESASIIDLMGEVINDLKVISRLDKSQDGISEDFEGSFSEITELSLELRNYIEHIEFNPQRLNQVEDRLDLITNLKRKYGKTISEILIYLQNAENERDTISNAAERIAELEIQEKRCLDLLAESGQALSITRHQAAEKLARGIEAELVELNMDGARFEVDIKMQLDPEGVKLDDGRVVRYSINGLDEVEFLIAPNPGEGLKPLVKIASGGETSRLMLGLKNVLAEADDIPTLIFDEIDQGIGGRVGTVVGNKLWNLARHHQVLCVTHLPQLAAFSEQHLQVSKNIQNGRTITQVSDLKGDARIPELAIMLGEKSEGTMQSARDMLNAASQSTKIGYV